jgi:hypothetical protein
MSKTTVEKKNIVMFIFLDFKTYHKAAKMKATWY